MKKIKILLIICIPIFLFIIVSYFFLFTNIGCGLRMAYDNWKEGDPPIPQINEIVMPPNATITAETQAGKIIIKSGKGLKRYYTWENATRSVVMWPRAERWYGSLGLYYPGPGSHWLPKHNGISRGVLEEGRQYFTSEKEATEWINQQMKWFPTVYRDDGLLVGFGKSLEREQLDVNVWQLFIDGKKPFKLDGSNNKAITTSWDDKHL
jgi:hypothetical protein